MLRNKHSERFEAIKSYTGFWYVYDNKEHDYSHHICFTSYTTERECKKAIKKWSKLIEERENN